MSTGDARQEPRHRPSREQVRGRNRARPLAVTGVLTLAGLAAGLMTAPLADAAGARLPHLRFGGGTATFTYTGAEQTFTVPAGTSSVSITAIGAAGGAGQDSTSSGGAGGQGRSATGTASVSPGETLYVEVGGVGLAGSIGGNGGFNGGADGSSYHSIRGGGGGGASDVRTISGTLGSRLVVAGGGGGGGGSSQGCTGNGGAGGNAGAAGSAAATVTGCGGITGGGGGGAGTGVGGGTAGAPGTGGCCGTAASAGTSGSGGAGGNIVGGGGGGGYYGGGGGGAGTDEIGPTSGGGGGGGGSSLDTTDNGAVSSAASVTITYTSSVPVAQRPSLRVSLRHHGVFHHGGTGEFDIWVTNNGGAPAEQTTTTMLHVPAGLSIIQGGKGPGWACHKGGHETTCRRSWPIGAGRRMMIAVTVRVKAAAGRTLHATATISPTDTTPATGTSMDKVIIRPLRGLLQENRQARHSRAVHSIVKRRL
jgi:hypothetical protein